MEQSSFLVQPTGSCWGVGTKVGWVTGGSVGLGVGLTATGGRGVETGSWPDTTGSSGGCDGNSAIGETMSGLSVVREVHFSCGLPVVP